MKRTVFEEPEFQVIRFGASDTTVVASDGVDEGKVDGGDISVLDDDDD